MSRRLLGRPEPDAGQDDALARLREILRVTRPGADIELIGRAYEAAEHWHQGQTRRSGDPYITHPLAVAAILAEAGADDEMLCAGLLHETIEDTPYTLDALSREFGAKVAALVTETAALDHAKGQGRRRAARVMAAAESADARAVVIKLADRLHNMRTIQFIPQAKQLRKAGESLDIFAPAAARLRMDSIGAELETLACATMKRNRHARSASGRLLLAVAALLPAATRVRWCEEWLGELHTLPARRGRARFAIHTMLGIPRLAVTVRLPAPRHRRPGR
jgi:(p)ppGpp synthase/HD superfamily hydrolase